MDNRTGILNKIEECENKIFYLAMKDVWSSKDYKLDTELRDRLRRLKMSLEICDEVFGNILKDIVEK